MAQKYTITDIAPNEPTTWQGPHGLVYYITVKVAEHNRPIEVGKKSANALSVGDELYGNITPGKFDVDKFKPEQKPDFGGGQQSFGRTPTRAATSRDDHTQESIARSVALKAAVDYVGQNPKGYIEQDVITQAEIFLAWLQGSSDEMKKIADSIRESDRQDAAVNPNKPWERITKGNGDYQSRLNAGENDYQAKKDERDEFNDIRAGNEEPLPSWPGDEGL